MPYLGLNLRKKNIVVFDISVLEFVEGYVLTITVNFGIVFTFSKVSVSNRISIGLVFFIITVNYPDLFVRYNRKIIL